MATGVVALDNISTGPAINPGSFIWKTNKIRPITEPMKHGFRKFFNEKPFSSSEAFCMINMPKVKIRISLAASRMDA